MLKKIKERLVLWMPAVMLIFLCGAVLDNDLVCYAAEKEASDKSTILLEGQTVKFSENLPSEYTYRTDEIQVEFEGFIATNNPDIYEVTVETKGGIFSSAFVKDMKISSEAGDNKLYEIFGTVAFKINNIGQDASVRVIIKDHKAGGVQIYADASAEYTFNVVKKALTVTAITFEDKIYDGTNDVGITSVSLYGIEADDDGKVEADIKDKVFKLTGSDAAENKEDGYALLFEDGGQKLELSGVCAEKYRIDEESCKSFKAIVKKRPINLNPNGLKLEQSYWADTYTKNDGEMPHVYNKALNMEALAATQCLYTNIIKKDEQEIFSAIQSCPIRFKADAKKTSGEGEYAIYADIPENMVVLKNYRYAFGGKRQAGTLTIGKADVAAEDFGVAGEGILKINEKSFYVRSSFDAARDIIKCVNSEKYNGVVYSDAEQYFNPSILGAKWPEADGQIAFTLVKREDGKLLACSKEYKMDFVSDGDVWTEITVNVNDQKNTFNEVPGEMSLKLFGNKRNTNAKIIYGDALSGIKACYYAIVDYDEWQKNSDYKAALKEFTKWQQAGTDVSIDFEDGRKLVISKVVDKVGNISYAMSDGIVIDSEAPNIIKAEILGGNRENVYNHEVEIAVCASDDAAEACSGIASVEYRVEISHDNKLWETYIEDTMLDVSRSSSVVTDREIFENQAVCDVSIKIAPDAGKHYSTAAGDENRMRVIVWSKDCAGNIAEKKTVEFDFDTAKPEIEILFDGSAVNKKYFNKDRIVTIKVTEAYFDSTGINCIADAVNGGAECIQPWMPIGEKIYEARYVYNSDGDWIFDIFMTDRAQNCTSMAESFGGSAYVPENYKAFTIDKTAPLVKEVRYYMKQGGNTVEIMPGHANEERFFGNAEIFSVLTIEERNFDKRDKGEPDESGLELYIHAANKGSNYAEPTHQLTVGNANMHTLRISYRGDANYTFDMQYTDLAGNTLEQDYAAQYFTVDTQNPEAQIATFGCIWHKINEKITFELFANHDKTVEIGNIYDATAGVSEVQYYKSHEAMTVRQLEHVPWVTGEKIILKPNQKAIVYGRITDKSGNCTYISTQGLILDNRLDAPQIDIETPKPFVDIYNSDVNVKIKAEDFASEGEYEDSGLKSVYYEVRNRNLVTQSGYLNIASPKARQKSVEEVITINAEKNNSNFVQIYVKVTDNAGNSKEKLKNLKIDITQPIIMVVFDNPAPLNGKYYKDARTATILIRERNFDANRVKINVMDMDGGKAQVSGWSSGAGADLSDVKVHTARIAFSEDGSYKFTVDCTDLALNKAKMPYVSEEFIIDKTPPIIQVAYDNCSGAGSYYNKERTAAIIIKENNFRAEDVKLKVTAVLKGKVLEIPPVRGWIKIRDKHMAVVCFNSDADYTFDIAYTDLAGNKAFDYAQDRFTVDLTNPEIEIRGVQHNSANNGIVAPEIKITDTNFSASGVQLYLSGVKKGKMTVEDMFSKTSFDSGQLISFRNFEKDMDDIYTLIIAAIDKSGNETQKRMTFSVNRNGSTYMISDDLQKLINGGFTNSPTDIIVKEINADTLEFTELTCSRAGKLIKMKEGVDYTVKSEGGSRRWKTYMYTIKAACFDEEGTYYINIYSEDRAKNISTNGVKGKSIEFTVDWTPPTMAVSDLEHRGRYREAVHTFTLGVKDNAKLAYAEMYIDGRLVHTYKQDELMAKDGTIKLNVDSKEDYQTIRLIAYDAAGNASEPLEYSVLVTPSQWIQFYMNKPLLIGVVLIFSAIICSLTFVRKLFYNNDAGVIR